MFAPLLPGGCRYLYVVWFLWFLGSLWAIFDHFTTLYRSRSMHYATQYKARFPRTPYASNRVSETMGVEEWANCRRGRVRESKCGSMCLTQEQPLLPPIKEMGFRQRYLAEKLSCRE